MPLELRFARSRGAIHAEHYTLRTMNGEDPVAVEQGWFRGVRVLHWGGELISYPRDLSPLLGCAIALQSEGGEWEARKVYLEPLTSQ